MLQPAQDVRIGVELPQVRAGAAHGADDLGLHVDHGPQARAVEDARAVIVNVVEAKPELGVLLHEQVVLLVLQEPAYHDLRFRHVQGDAVVGVGHVACRGQQEGRGCPRPFPRRQYRERNVELVLVRVQAHRVETAAHPVRNLEREVCVPAGVVEIVVVEVDGRVALGRLLPADRIRAAEPSSHAPGRQVDQRAVQAPGRDIDQAIAGNADRKIPGGHEIVVAGAPGPCTQPGDHAVERECRCV